MVQVVFAIVVVLDLPRTVAGLIAFARMVVERMTGNPYFAGAAALVSEAGAAVEAYADVVAATASTKGLAGARANKKKALVQALKQLRDAVRVAAEADVALAEAIVESAGMRLWLRTPYAKPPLAVKQGALSGTVVCSARSVGKPATYYFSYSLDHEHWQSVPDSLKSKVTISGLTPGQTYYFRFSALTRKGTTNPSQEVSLLVK